MFLIIANQKPNLDDMDFQTNYQLPYNAWTPSANKHFSQPHQKIHFHNQPLPPQQPHIPPPHFPPNFKQNNLHPKVQIFFQHFSQQPQQPLQQTQPQQPPQSQQQQPPPPPHHRVSGVSPDYKHLYLQALIKINSIQLSKNIIHDSNIINKLSWATINELEQHGLLAPIGDSPYDPHL